jgi:hypothetical protein
MNIHISSQRKNGKADMSTPVISILNVKTRTPIWGVISALMLPDDLIQRFAHEDSDIRIEAEFDALKIMAIIEFNYNCRQKEPVFLPVSFPNPIRERMRHFH